MLSMNTKHRRGKLWFGIIWVALLCHHIFQLQEISYLIWFFAMVFFAEMLDYVLYITWAFGISWKKNDFWKIRFKGASLEKFDSDNITIVVRNWTISVNWKQTHTSDDTYALYGRSFENKFIDIVLEKRDATAFVMKQSSFENMKESEKKEVYGMVCDVLSYWRK